MDNRTFGKRNLTVCEAKLQFNTVNRPSHNTYILQAHAPCNCISSKGTSAPKPIHAPSPSHGTHPQLYILSCSSVRQYPCATFHSGLCASADLPSHVSTSRSRIRFKPNTPITSNVKACVVAPIFDRSSAVVPRRAVCCTSTVSDRAAKLTL
jgi:hypothetical protein